MDNIPTCCQGPDDECSVDGNIKQGRQLAQGAEVSHPTTAEQAVLLTENDNNDSTDNNCHNPKKENKQQHDDHKYLTILTSLSLPWGVIVEYNTFPEVLQVRLVCRGWRDGVKDAISPHQGAKYLAAALVERNLYLVTNTTTRTTWKSSWTRSVEELIEQLTPSSSPPPPPIVLPQPTQTKQSTIVEARSKNPLPKPNEAKESTTSTTTKRTTITAVPSSSLPSSSSSTLDRLLRIFRVLRYMPQQAAVAFNRKHGRHIVPMEWDSEQEQTTVVSFPPCTRGTTSTSSSGEGGDRRQQRRRRQRHSSCATCTFSIPTRSTTTGTNNLTTTTTNQRRRRQHTTSSNIDDYLEFLVILPKVSSRHSSDRKRQRQQPLDGDGTAYHDACLDLKHYYTTCVPNLPPDLSCPKCHFPTTTQQREQHYPYHRTLVLSEVSYQSDTVTTTHRPNQVLLTLTPKLEEEEDEEEASNDDGIQDGGGGREYRGGRNGTIDPPQKS